MYAIRSYYVAFEVSVFLENKITHFESITTLLKKEGINIRSITLNSMSHGWGVLNMLVDQPEKAYKLLSDHGHSVSIHVITSYSIHYTKLYDSGIFEFFINQQKQLSAL